MLRHHTTDISITYFCLALCSVGCAVCKVCLSKMESPMGAVAKFTSGQEIPGYRLMRRVSREVASLLGQMLALVALTVLCFLAGQRLPHTAEEIAASFQPVMVVPALITAFIALLCVLRFPLSNRYMQKVLRFCTSVNPARKTRRWSSSWRRSSSSGTFSRWASVFDGGDAPVLPPHGQGRGEHSPR